MNVIEPPSEAVVCETLEAAVKVIMAAYGVAA